MKVAITRFPYESQLSGEEWHTIDLFTFLKQHDIHADYYGSCGVFLNELPKHGIKSHQRYGGLALVSKWAFLRFLFTWPVVLWSFYRLARELKQKKYHLMYMHSLNEKLFLTPFLKKYGLKVIWVEHARIGKWLLKNPFFWLYQQNSKNVPVISVSAQHSQSLRSIKSLVTIPNGIKPADFKRTSVDRVQFYRHLLALINEKSTIIGYAGRLSADKGLPYLLTGFANFLTKNPDSYLMIVGSGAQKDEYMALARQLKCAKRVFWLHTIKHDEMAKWYSTLDVFILPSAAHDPYGLVAAEAMAAEVPVVVTTVCGITDLLTHKQEAYLIKPKSHLHIETALTELTSNQTLSKKIAQQGHQWCQTYNHNHMCTQYLKLFQDA